MSNGFLQNTKYLKNLSIFTNEYEIKTNGLITSCLRNLESFRRLRNCKKKEKLNFGKLKRILKHDIPCYYMKNENGVNKDKLVIYFHANAEDIFAVQSFLKLIYVKLGISILCPEYPGYSINKNNSPNEDTINQ